MLRAYVPGPLPSSLWKLDLCTTVLPQIEKLLQSKYERYVREGRWQGAPARTTGKTPRTSAHVRCLCSTAVPFEFQRGQSENKLCRL